MYHQLHLRGEKATSRLLVNSSGNSSTLAVFCHGWHGDLVKTWGALNKLYALHHNDEGPFEDVDILFLGYNSSPTSIDLLASWIRDRIVSVFPSWSAGNKYGNLTGSYKRLLLVGHSLGTLGMRKAVLELDGNKDSEVLAGLEMTLFAPPLCGVDWQTYLDAVKTSWLNPIAPILRIWQRAREPVADQLQSGSSFLHKLREETNKAIDANAVPAAHLVLGLSDRVVAIDDIKDFCYQSDTHEIKSEADHVSVCKFESLADLGWLDSTSTSS